jgi:hypothetical protein
LLIEEARTNLFLRSEEFDNAYWIKSGATVTGNNVVAPNGTLTADTLVAPASPGYGGIYISISLTATQYTMSVFAKGSVTIYMYLATSGFGIGGWGEYNLSTGQVTKITNFGATTGSTASITPVGNGWYRCSLTVLCTATTYVPIIGTYVPSAVIWGAQLEAGAFATSYIPTVAAQVTRNADAASMTGSNFTSWFNSAEGTLYAEGSTFANASSASRTFIQIDDTTTSNRIMINRAISSSIAIFTVTVAGVSQADIPNGGAIADGSNAKMVGAYQVNNFAFSSNANSASTDTSGTIPVVRQMLIGSRAGATNFLNGTIKKIAYYPLRITNANLQALTS